MAITPFPDPAPADAAGVVASACAHVDGVAEVLWSARGDEELVAGVEEIQQLKSLSRFLCKRGWHGWLVDVTGEPVGVVDH